MKAPLEIIQEIEPAFKELKKFIDIYPNAFKLFYAGKEHGYVLDFNLDNLEHKTSGEAGEP